MRTDPVTVLLSLVVLRTTRYLWYSCVSGFGWHLHDAVRSYYILLVSFQKPIRVKFVSSWDVLCPAEYVLWYCCPQVLQVLDLPRGTRMILLFGCWLLQCYAYHTIRATAELVPGINDKWIRQIRVGCPFDFNTSPQASHVGYFEYLNTWYFLYTYNCSRLNSAVPGAAVAWCPPNLDTVTGTAVSGQEFIHDQYYQY